MPSSYAPSRSLPTAPTLAGSGAGRDYKALAQFHAAGAGAQPAATPRGASYAANPTGASTGPSQSAGTGTPRMANGQPFQQGMQGTESNPQPMGYYSGRTFIQTGPNAGAVWYPIPPAGTTNRSAFTPWQLPGIESQSGSSIRYSDGSYVDTNSLAYQQARNLVFQTPEMNAVWQRLPLSWQANMAGWQPETRASWLQAAVRGDQQGMLDAQKQQTSYGQAQQQAETAQQRQQAAYKMPTSYAPAYA